MTQYTLDGSWSAAPVDLCWMDCSSEDGRLKRVGSRVIVLCPYHATVLEAGRVYGSYDGAELPAESTSAEWPWLADEAA